MPPTPGPLHADGRLLSSVALVAGLCVVAVACAAFAAPTAQLLALPLHHSRPVVAAAPPLSLSAADRPTRQSVLLSSLRPLVPGTDFPAPDTATSQAPQEVVLSWLWPLAAPAALLAAALLGWAQRERRRLGAAVPLVQVALADNLQAQPWRMAAAAEKIRKPLTKDPYADDVRLAFMGWLEQQGLPEQPVSLKYVGKAGWGLVADKPLQRGDVAIRVPKSLLITKETATAGLPPPIAELIRAKNLPDFWVLAIFLVENYAATEQKEPCPYAPYILSLPRETGSVLEWGRSSITDLLKGSPVESTAYELNNDVNDAIAWLSREMPGISPRYGKFYTRENLRWAFAILFSRVVRLTAMGSTLALIPWADMLNHSPTVSTHIDWDEAEQAVTFRVDQRYELGEEVFTSYGPRTSGDLLLTYGFVPRNRRLQSGNEKVELKLQVDPSDPYAGPKTQMLVKYGLQTPATFPLQLNAYPKNIVPYATFLAFEPKSEKDVEEMAEKLLGPNPKRVPEEVEALGRKLVKQTCFDVLSRFKGTAEDDKKVLQPQLEKQAGIEDFMAQDSRAAAAAVVRLRERAILKKTAESIESPGDWLTDLMNTNPMDFFENVFKRR
eukprot:EG_transcript_6882